MAHFTAEEIHDFIIEYLKEIDKETNVFHLTWKQNDLLDVMTLIRTPIYWYIKYLGAG